jgi:hypothetical protein
MDKNKLSIQIRLILKYKALISGRILTVNCGSGGLIKKRVSIVVEVIGHWNITILPYA